MKRALSAFLTVSEKIRHFAGKCGAFAGQSGFTPITGVDGTDARTIVAATLATARQT
jgi:hypothetical protein